MLHGSQGHVKAFETIDASPLLCLTPIQITCYFPSFLVL